MRRNQKGNAGVVVLVVVGVILLPFLIWGAKVALAPLFGAGNARIITHDPLNRIAQYNHFYDLCSDVQALELQLEAYESGETGLPEDQVATNVLALKGQRNALVTQYNADAAKTATAGQFKAHDLPAEIDANNYNTECQ